MKKLKESICLFLSLTVLLSSVPASAQTFPFLSYKQQNAKANALVSAIQMQNVKRQGQQTVAGLIDQYWAEGVVNGQTLAAILNDEQYILSLTAEEAADVIMLSSFAQFSSAAQAAQLLNAITKKLQSAYDENAQDYSLKMFYAMTLSAFGRHSWLWRDVHNWAFAQVNAAADRARPDNKVWAAYVLMLLASDAQTEMPYSMDEQARWRFEQKLEGTLRKFNWLQYEQADYYVTGVKNKIGLTNQAALISLFAQANSFFSMKDDDGFLKQMVSAGGLNPVGRAIMTDEENAPARFSDRAESFYLHHTTPGTDGKGHFTMNDNGRRHLMVSLLVQALFLSYYMRPVEESSAQMQVFVRRFLQTKTDGTFASYLYIPLQGIRLGSILHDTNSLDGWEKEAAALEEDLYEKLKAGYPWQRVCTGVQGACEVAVEWAVMGKVFGWVFRGLGWGAKATGRQIVRALPDKAILHLALVEMAASQGRKAFVGWNKKVIQKMLGSLGWKGAATATAAGVLLQSDVRSGSVLPAR